jgi:hypothetical protein
MVGRPLDVDRVGGVGDVADEGAVEGEPDGNEVTSAGAGDGLEDIDRDAVQRTRAMPECFGISPANVTSAEVCCGGSVETRKMAEPTSSPSSGYMLGFLRDFCQVL